MEPSNRVMNKHRRLFNADSHFFFYNTEIWQPEGGPYQARAIARALWVVASGRVDTFLANPNTTVAWYPTRTLEWALEGYTRGNKDFVAELLCGHRTDPSHDQKVIETWTRMLDARLDLVEGGINWLSLCAEECRNNGMSPWLTYRMNDTHGAAAPGSRAHCRLYRDPSARLSGCTPNGTTDASWVGLNYADKRVRDFYANVLREGVEEYDYEGLEMDWLRHPVCMEAPARDAQIRTMTDWIGGIREMTKRVRADYVMGLRIPADLDYLLSIGIDVAELVRRGLVDFVSFSNFWQCGWDIPLDDLRRRLGDNVTIVGCIEDAPNWLEAVAPALTERQWYQEAQLTGDDVRFFDAEHGGSPARAQEQTMATTPIVRGTRYLSSSAELIRGSVASRIAIGADAVEFFNFFVTDQVMVQGQHALYRELSAAQGRDSLVGATKHYCTTTPSFQPTMYWDHIEPLPAVLAPRQRHRIRLPMLEEPEERDLCIRVQVVMKRTQSDSMQCRRENHDTGSSGTRLGVSLNGAWPNWRGVVTRDLLFPSGPYALHVPENEAVEFSFRPVEVRDGWNEITIFNGCDASVNVIALEIAVDRSCRQEEGDDRSAD